MLGRVKTDSCTNFGSNAQLHCAILRDSNKRNGLSTVPPPAPLRPGASGAVGNPLPQRWSQHASKPVSLLECREAVRPGEIVNSVVGHPRQLQATVIADRSYARPASSLPRRQPVVTTRKLPSTSATYGSLSEVTTPSDGLPDRRHPRSRNAIAPPPALRGIRALPRRDGAPHFEPGSTARLDGWHPTGPPSKPIPRAAVASSKATAQHGRGVPSPS